MSSSMTSSIPLSTSESATPLADTETKSSLPTRDDQKEKGHEGTPFPPPKSSTAAVVPPVAAAAAVVGSTPAAAAAAAAKGAVSEEDPPGTTKTAEGVVTTTNSHDVSTKGTKSEIESTDTKNHNGNNNVNDSKHTKQQTGNLIKKRPEPPQMSPSPQSLQEHITICLPIVYGSVAFALPKAEEYNTHQWTLYVRGPNHEDLSHGIAKVVFQLHPSFAQPIREITAPPFEVTEKGWGEFEASIRIVWRDPSEKALVLMHMIKLYPPLPTATTAGLEEGQGVSSVVPGGGGTSGGKNSKEEVKPVIHEYYDEVVFTNPTESFQKHLLSASKTWMSSSSSSSSLPNSAIEGGEYPKVLSNEPDVQKSFRSYSDQEDFKKLLEAYKFLEQELQAVKDRILLADCHRNELEKALAAVTVKAKSMVAVPAPAAAATATATPAVSAPVAAPVKRKASKTSGAGGNSKKIKTSSGTRTPPNTNAKGVAVSKSATHHRTTNKKNVLPTKAALNTGAPTAAPASGILPNKVESTSVVGARPSLATDMASTAAVSSMATTTMPKAPITTPTTTTTTTNVPTTTPANMPTNTSSASTSK